MPRVKLLGQEKIAERTLAFTFSKPEGFAYKAGQFVELTLLGGDTGGRASSHPFTLASAPAEENLAVATRMRDSDYKKTLGALDPGAEVLIEGAFGNLTLPQDASRPLVFLAGGIGVTPFRSMAVQAARRNLPHRITLFYSNRRPEDAAYLEELQKLAGEQENFTLVATMTQPEKSAREWTGATGRLDAALLTKHLDLDAPVFYSAGPPAMVDAMEKILSNAGVARDRLRLEHFSGY